ncbi:DUF624 domain-containing protein [Nonomuraea sp. SBT364]|uniref:DUF624 domain-containing protein n=1 Tax=Nonomuraea sp. SBT364 TaxID=1580530 RepID=UPI00066E9521|nr:DUF624 domain-containing protein [Nonomuraea sp. SBT364]
MSETATAKRFGEGVLSRAAALIYTLLTIELLLLVSIVPSLAGLVLLDRDAGNVPLAAACLLPVGPALSAAVYALRRRSRDLADLRPAAAFWQGYKANVRGVLKIWTPWLAWLAVVGVSLANFGAAGLPGWWAALLVVVAVAATLWVANALVITSLYEFRTADVARLASYFLARTPGVTLGNLCLLVLAGGVTLVASEAALALLAFAMAAALLRNSRPMIAEIEERFTR